MPRTCSVFQALGYSELITALTSTIPLYDDKHALYRLGRLRLSGNQFTQSAMRARGNRERDRVESNLP